MSMSVCCADRQPRLTWTAKTNDLYTGIRMVDGCVSVSYSKIPACQEGLIFGV